MAGPCRVLIIEDDPVFAASCADILSTAGYSPVVAHGGDEGIRCALGEKFDLIITDLRLPDADGLELVKALMEKGRAAAFIMITGHPTLSVAVEAVRSGVSAFLEKPFPPEDLLEAARRALEEARQRRSLRIDADLVREILPQPDRSGVERRDENSESRDRGRPD